jgi:hypothetical protein
LSIPYISSVVPSDLVFDDDDGVDVDSGKESIQRIIPILSIKIAMEKYSKDSIHSSPYVQLLITCLQVTTMRTSSLMQKIRITERILRKYTSCISIMLTSWLVIWIKCKD